MLTKEQDEVIVLSKTDKGEADRVFTVLAQHEGKINLFAKGERKILSKLRRAMDLFYLTRATFIESPIRITLTDVTLIDGFPALRHNWRKFQVAGWISDLLNLVLPLKVKDEEIFLLTKESLEDLNQATESFQRYYYYFFWRFLKVLGYQPEMGFSKSFSEKFFVSSSRGIIKSKTGENRLINPEVKFLIQSIFQGEKENFYRQDISLSSQKNLTETSSLYFDFLALVKDSHSFDFKL